MLVSDVAREYLHMLTVERSAPQGTVRNYAHAWALFAEATTPPQGPPLAVREVTRAVLRAWLAGQIAAGLSAATVGQRLSALRAGLTFAVDAGYLDANPAVGIRRPRPRRRLPAVLTATEVEQFLDAPLAPDDLAVRDRAILEVLFGSAIRAGELCGLTLADLDPDAGTLRVVGKGNVEGVVPLGARGWAAMEAYLRVRPPGSALFLSYRERALTPHTVLRIVKRRAREAGLTRRVWSHLLRHSAACALLRGGANVRVVQAVLRHTNLATTSTYLHVTLPEVLADYRKAHPRAA